MEEPADVELRRERDALRTALGRVGVWSFALETQTAAEERDAAAEIESLGYGAIWFGEGVESREAFSHAGWLLASTERAVVATGIANMWARDPIAMANGWWMLTDAYPGRFLLGVGVSHAPSVGRRDSAFPRMVLAALGPRMLSLAAERTLGAHPYFVPVEHTAFARQRLGPGPVLAVEQTVVLETDPAKARKVARAFASDYLRTANYATNLKRMGWTDAELSRDGSDALIDAVVAWGDVDKIALRVRQHLDAGADHVCVQPVTDDENDVAVDALRELAPALLEL